MLVQIPRFRHAILFIAILPPTLAFNLFLFFPSNQIGCGKLIFIFLSPMFHSHWCHFPLFQSLASTCGAQWWQLAWSALSTAHWYVGILAEKNLCFFHYSHKIWNLLKSSLIMRLPHGSTFHSVDVATGTSLNAKSSQYMTQPFSVLIHSNFCCCRKQQKDRVHFLQILLGFFFFFLI